MELDKELLKSFFEEHKGVPLYVCAVDEELETLFTIAAQYNISIEPDEKVVVGKVYTLIDEDVGALKGFAYCTGVTYFNAWKLILAIQEIHPESVIGFGTCASLSEDYKIGNVIVSKEFATNDLDLTIFGYNMGDLTKEKLDYTHMQISGSKFLNSDYEVVRVMSKFPAIKGFDMESYMWYSVCKSCNIPFISVRGVSDAGDNDSGNSYEKNAKFASANVARYVLNHF